MPKPSKSPRSCKFSRSQTKRGQVRKSCTASKARYTSRRCSISKSNRCVVKRGSMSKSASRRASPKKTSKTIELVSDIEIAVMKPVSARVIEDIEQNLKNLAPPTSAEKEKVSIQKKSPSSRLYVLKKFKKRKSPSSGIRAPNASLM